MALSALHLGNDLCNVWLEKDGGPEKIFALSLFTDGLSETDEEELRVRGKARRELGAAWRNLQDNPDDAGAWRTLSEMVKELQAHFSFLDHMDQLPVERFESPLNAGEAMVFGEHVLRRLWSLPVVYVPLRRLRKLRGKAFDGRDYSYYDRETATFSDPEPLYRDVRIVRALLRHLIRARREAGEPLRVVLGTPLPALAPTHAIFHKLAREAGFKAVILRPEEELITRHALGTVDGPSLILNFGTVGLDVSLCHEVDGRIERHAVHVDNAGIRFDREIEHFIQEAIRRSEGDGDTRPVFEPISASRLFFWKDARVSTIWPRIRDSEAWFSEFQYPYKVRDKLTFRDVRPLLEDTVLVEAAETAFAEPLERALRHLRRVDKRAFAAATERVIVAGSGSRLDVIPRLVSEAVATVLEDPGAEPRVEAVSEALDAVVEGAWSTAATVSEDDWAAIEALQADWDRTPLEDLGLETWFKTWSGLMADEASRRTLKFPLSYTD